MTNEINAHAAAKWGVASTDATVNATPPGAASPCCEDSSVCAADASDPVAEAAARRVEIEAARDELESAVAEYVDGYLHFQLPFRDWQPLFDRVIVAWVALRELRKGAT